MFSIGVNLLYLTGSGVVFILLLISIEYNIFPKLFRAIFSTIKLPSVDISLRDYDIQEEKEKVDAMKLDDLQVYDLILKNVSKLDDQSWIVNQISLAVKRYEKLTFLLNN